MLASCFSFSGDDVQTLQRQFNFPGRDRDGLICPTVSVILYAVCVRVLYGKKSTLQQYFGRKPIKSRSCTASLYTYRPIGPLPAALFACTPILVLTYKKNLLACCRTTYVVVTGYIYAPSRIYVIYYSWCWECHYCWPLCDVRASIRCMCYTTCAARVSHQIHVNYC
jgi:hypothetical protein